MKLTRKLGLMGMLAVCSANIPAMELHESPESNEGIKGRGVKEIERYDVTFTPEAKQIFPQLSGIELTQVKDDQLKEYLEKSDVISPRYTIAREEWFARQRDAAQSNKSKKSVRLENQASPAVPSPTNSSKDLAKEEKFTEELKPIQREELKHIIDSRIGARLTPETVVKCENAIEGAIQDLGPDVPASKTTYVNRALDSVPSWTFHIYENKWKYLIGAVLTIDAAQAIIRACRCPEWKQVQVKGKLALIADKMYGVKAVTKPYAYLAAKLRTK